MFILPRSAQRWNVGYSINRFVSLLIVPAILVLSGCAELADNNIHIGDRLKRDVDASQAKYLASVRIADYADGRAVANPRKIGVAEVRVRALSGTDIVLDRDAADVVTASMRQQLAGTGIRVAAADDPGAQFELGGVVKQLSYDVKVRDQIHIKLDSTLKEVATGKVVWSGEVEQDDDRFAGVAGNSKSDIADHLVQQVGIVTGKTAEAISSLLMATRPELFNVTPGTQAIPGVKVLVAPGVTPTGAPAPAPGASPIAAVNGVLVLSTTPARAKVYLDDVYFGMSPLRAEVAPGIHRLEVKLDSYRTATEKISIRKGDTTELELRLVR